MLPFQKVQMNSKGWDQSKSKIQQAKHIPQLWGNLWRVNTKWLGWHQPCGTSVVVAPMAYLLGHPAPSYFSSAVHVPGFSKLLGSPLHLWHRTHSFTHCLLRGTLFGLPDLKSGGGLPDPTTLPFCMYLKPVPHGWCKGLLPAGAVVVFPLSFRMPGLLNTLNPILRNKFSKPPPFCNNFPRPLLFWNNFPRLPPFWNVVLWVFSKQILSPLQLWGCKGWSPAASCDALRLSFLLCSFSAIKISSAVSL